MSDQETAMTVTESEHDTLSHSTAIDTYLDPRNMLMPRSINDVGTLAKVFSGSGMYAAEGKPLTVQQCVVIILTGVDLGLTPSQAMRGIAVIKGKPSPSADMLVACARKRSDVCEYIQVLESSASIVRMSGKRPGDVQPTITQFTIEDAKAAGLTSSGGMYSKYPEQMLYARCAVKLVRRLWPDVALGLYTPDELKDGKVNEAESGLTVSATGTHEPVRYIQPESSGKTSENQTDEPDPFVTKQRAPVNNDPIPSFEEATMPVDDTPAAVNLKAARGALNDRVRALSSQDKEALKEFCMSAFNGKFMPALFTQEQIDLTAKALDALAADPMLDLLTFDPTAVSGSGEGHGAS